MKCGNCFRSLELKPFAYGPMSRRLTPVRAASSLASVIILSQIRMGSSAILANMDRSQRFDLICASSLLTSSIRRTHGCRRRKRSCVILFGLPKIRRKSDLQGRGVSRSKRTIKSPAMMTIAAPVSVIISGTSPNTIIPHITAQIIAVYSNGAIKEASACL